jgi:hypothetical protein
MAYINKGAAKYGIKGAAYHIVNAPSELHLTVEMVSNATHVHTNFQSNQRVVWWAVAMS